MMLLIAGRSASGKDRLQQELRDMFGLSPVMSSTTRPRRPGEGDTHVFLELDEEQLAKARETAVAWTDIGNYSYFATREDVESADMYIIDPPGIREICQTMPDEVFIIVNVRADEQARLAHAMSRAQGDEDEVDVFRRRSEDESQRFDEFEDMVDRHMAGEPDVFPENVIATIVVTNDFVPSTMATAASVIETERIAYDNVRLMLSMCAEAGHMQADEKGHIPTIDENGETKYVRQEILAAEIMRDHTALGQLTSRWIRLDRISDNIVSDQDVETVDEEVPNAHR